MANIVFQDGSGSIPSPVLIVLQPTVLDAYFAKMTSVDVDAEGNSNETQDHVVVKGNVLSNIAPIYNTTEKVLIKLNSNITESNKHLIKLGQKIKVPKKNTKKKVSFTQINEGEMGDEVYIVVKTEYLTSEKVLINIHQGIEDMLVKKGELITVQVEGVDKTLIETSVGNLCEDDSISNGDDFVDWAVIKVTLEPKSDTLKKEWTDALQPIVTAKSKLSLLVDVHSEHSTEGFLSKYVDYKGYTGEGDDSTIPNMFLNEEGKWFELNRKPPIIVLDPGHGYSSGNVGSATRKYHHKVKGTDGKPKKDKKGNFIINKSVKLNDLPQYVLEDIDAWITGHHGDSPGKNERELVYDVAHAMYNALITAGHTSKSVHIFRPSIDFRDKNKGKTLKERISESNKLKADYYISIHADGSNTYSTSGAHAIYSASNNSKFGKTFAKDILKHYTIVTITAESPKKDQRNLAVFKSNHKAKRVTLVEMGYVTNPKEAKLMFANSTKIGKELAKGLIDNIKSEY